VAFKHRRYKSAYIIILKTYHKSRRWLQTTGPRGSSERIW